ncbi:kinase-like protein [Auricularia subglabra TFB-10046 SS5]|nr:kinase-like protein [Auricularia subglabra TFB-10046 SS5]
MGAAKSILSGGDAKTIEATALDGGRHFKVKIRSLHPIAEGTCAVILKGTIAVPPFTQPVVVALKVFKLPVNLNPHDEKVVDALHRKELDAARRLDAFDRHVLPFMGVARMDYHPVIISRFMKNGNVLHYVEQRASVPLIRQKMIIQVAEALSFLHDEVGVVHGDLKCENVLVSDDERALLADFGLSPLIDRMSSNSTALVARNHSTLRFAAPEILTDEAIDADDPERPRSTTRETDVWAFGMLIIQLFTGRAPWPDVDDRVVYHKILASPPGELFPKPNGDTDALGLTDSWWKIFLLCTQRAAASRPTMAAVLDMLRAARSCTKDPEGAASRPPSEYGGGSTACRNISFSAHTLSFSARARSFSARTLASSALIAAVPSISDGPGTGDGGVGPSRVPGPASQPVLSSLGSGTRTAGLNCGPFSSHRDLTSFSTGAGSSGSGCAVNGVVRFKRMAPTASTLDATIAAVVPATALRMTP